MVLDTKTDELARHYVNAKPTPSAAISVIMSKEGNSLMYFAQSGINRVSAGRKSPLANSARH